MAALVLISCCIYGLQLAVFHDSHNTFFYFFQDMAFLPVTIAITTVVIGAVLDRRSKKDRIESSRILTSAFFSILGMPMVEHLCRMLDEDMQLRWDEEEVDQILDLLNQNQNNILTIASNPNLLEHAAFTDLLWAVLHLREELSSRKASGGSEVSEQDQAHLLKDAQRVLDLYISNWDEYRDYTAKEYPYFARSEAFTRWQEQADRIKAGRKKN